MKTFKIFLKESFKRNYNFKHGQKLIMNTDFGDPSIKSINDHDPRFNTEVIWQTRYDNMNGWVKSTNNSHHMSKIDDYRDGEKVPMNNLLSIDDYEKWKKSLKSINEEVLNEYRPSFPAKYANKETNAVKSFKEYSEYRNFMDNVPADKKDDWYYVPKDKELADVAQQKEKVEKSAKRFEPFKPVLNSIGQALVSVPKGMAEELYGTTPIDIDKISNIGDLVQELENWDKRQEKLDKLLDQYKDNKRMYESLLNIKKREKAYKKQLLLKKQSLINNK